VLFILLASFIGVEAFDVPLLRNPTPQLVHAGSLAGLLAVALLAADALLPVPASLVMVALGALFGPVIGTFLALSGRLAMALVGYGIGLRGGPLLSKVVLPDGRERADRLLRRWGAVAVVFTRPIPLVAETVVILAGASSIGWARVGLAALVGSVPEAVLYTLSGAFARGFEEAALVWTSLLILACGFWRATRWAERRLGA
jgi:uncharacterized membrane protein YdjX (TVP38/TMEM64 family)